MAKFNTKIDNKTYNLAGGKAMKMNAPQELLHAVLSTFLEDKYYESGDERLERIIQLIPQCKPDYVAKLAYVARHEFNLRSVPIVLLGELSKIHKGDSLVMKAVEKTIERVDDMTELVSYLDCKLPKQVKRGLRRAILKFSPYQLAKYRGEKKEVKLVDVFNMVHPNPKFATKEQAEAWGKLMKGELKSTGQTWEAVISASKDKAKDWENLVLEGKLGYMALLRNLNNLIKADVSEKVLAKAIEKLTNKEEVKRSKQLPYRFITAYENVTDSRQLRDAISIAMDYAVDNTPQLEGSTLIAVDGSGSMEGDPIRKASIFGATLLKANTLSDLIIYDTEVQEYPISSRIPVIDIAQGIEDNAEGGGTETSLVFKYALRKARNYSRIIIISDNESWAEGYWGGNTVQSEYNEYKKITKTDPYIYAIDIQGYGTKDVGGERVTHLTGWSAKLLDFIGLHEKGASMVDYINSIEL